MSTEKTLNIIDLFTNEKRVFTVTQIAEELNLPASSVYRYVRTLKENDFLQEREVGHYSLSYKFLKYYRIVKLDSSLSMISEEPMKRLTNVLGETTILLVYSNLQAVCLTTTTSLNAIKVTSAPGEIVPLYGGASSKALLAFLDESIADDLYEKTEVLQHTTQTITNLLEMKEHLKDIRQKGYAYSDSEIDEGVVGYGIPIFDSNRNVIASLSVAGLKDRMLNKESAEILSELKMAARDIEKLL